MKNVSLAFLLLLIIGFSSNAQETENPGSKNASALLGLSELVGLAQPESEPAVVEETAEPAPEPEPEPEPEDEPEPEPDPEPEGGLGLLYIFLSSGGLMGLLQVLRKSGLGPNSIPAAFRPFVGSGLALLAWGANELFGGPLDFSVLEAILVGTGAGTLHNAGSSAGLLRSTGPIE